MKNIRRPGAVPPTPALVLLLDRLGLEVAADVESIFLRGDRRRAAVTCFVALTYDSEGRPALRMARKAAARDERPGTRREACQSIMDHLASLQAGLEVKLRELYTHQRLIEAGLGEVLAPPLDLFLVADLTDPASSGAVLPLAYLIQELAVHRPEGKGHLLLSTASFEPADGTGMRDTLAFAALQDLEDQLDPGKRRAGRRLAEDLGLGADTTLSLPIYLFDHHKEGTREVEDRAELRVILGNFLLALLSGGLAQRLAEQLPLPEVLERRAFYGSGAATALVFEPQPLIEACAARLGAEYLAAETGPDTPVDLRAATEWAKRRESQMGTPRLWMERLCSNTPCEVQSDSDGLRLGLHFHGFRFEGVPKEDWADKITSYSVLFGQTKLPRYKGTIEENAKALAEEMAAELERALDTLPAAAQSYPGRLRTARLALQKLDERLQDRVEELSSGAQAVPLHEEASLEELDQAAWNFPDLPAFVARPVFLCAVEVYAIVALVRGFRPHLAGNAWLAWLAALTAGGLTAGACALWLWRKDYHLVELRERSIRYCEMRYASLLEGAAREHLIAMCQKLRDQVASALDDLSKLEESLAVTRKQLDGVWEAYSGAGLGTEETKSDHQGVPGHSPFRPSPVDGGIAAWVYGRWRQTPEEMRQPLLEEHGLLSDWRSVTPETLVERLLTHGRMAYEGVWGITLRDVLRRRRPDVAQAQWDSLAQQTIPLARPVFDSLGGGGRIHSAHYLLVADSELPATAAATPSAFSDWEVVATGDPYVAVCCRTRQLLPLAALQDLWNRGQKAYQALKADAATGMHLYE